jgi:hypothetical protein
MNLSKLTKEKDYVFDILRSVIVSLESSHTVNCRNSRILFNVIEYASVCGCYYDLRFIVTDIVLHKRLYDEIITEHDDRNRIKIYQHVRDFVRSHERLFNNQILYPNKKFEGE